MRKSKPASKQPAKKRVRKTAAGKRRAKKAEERNKDIVESQIACAARIGCPIEHVKLAKSLGSMAFLPNNRISVSGVEEYLQSEEFKSALTQSLEDTTSADWDKRLKRAKALREEHRLEVEKGKAWDAEQVRMLIGAGDVAMAETLRRWLESEQPPLIEGKSAAEILKTNRKFLDDLLADLKASRATAMERLGETLADDDEEDEGE